MDVEQAPFPAYEGDAPYIFVCYSHADAAIVYPELVWLREQGFNLWFDEGIGLGSGWRDEVADAIERADSLLFFVSPSAASSAHCVREVYFAQDSNIPVIPIYVRPTELPSGLRLAIRDRQAIFLFSSAKSDYERKVKAALRNRQTAEQFAEQANVASTSRARVQFPSIAVIAEDASDATSRQLVASVARYLSWHTAAFRIIAPNDVPKASLADYVIQVSLTARDEFVAFAWQVSRFDAGEVISASRSQERADAATTKHERIAEMIAEATLVPISDHELRRIAPLPLHQLQYGQLLLGSEQLSYLQRGEVERRAEHLDAAIALEPQQGLAHALLCNLLAWQLINGISDDAQRDRARMSEEAEIALRLEPNNSRVLLNVGLAYSRTGEFESGLPLIRRSIALAPTVRAKDELARALCFAGQPAEAIALFEEIIDSMPAGHVFPYGRLAVALTQAGRLRDALEYAQMGTVHFPADFYGWLVLANLLGQFDRVDEALRALNEAKRLVKALRLEIVIARTEASYGRVAEQGKFLTAGLTRLQEMGG
jgi:tetratricopeptide (TPR) repeat protein